MKRIVSYLPLLIVLVLPFRALMSMEMVDVIVADKNVIAVIVETSGSVNENNPNGVPIPTQNANNWQVNGTNPVEVGRYSYVYYQSLKNSNDWYNMTLRHHMYLRLSSDLANGTTYTVTSPQSQTISLTFNDESTFCESIKVNQVGYFGDSEKRFAIFGIFMGDMGTRQLSPIPTFRVLNQTNNTVMSGQLDYRGLLNDAGEHVYRMDISALPDGGPYRISIPGYGVSYPFGVGAASIEESNYVHLRGLYHQRCGIALEEPYTAFTRAKCHETVFVMDAEPPDTIKNAPIEGPERAISGGYHDAGDFDRRPSHTMIPIWMLGIYEAFPNAFYDGQYNLPESGNGVPDWLDECLWGLKIWEELQEPNGAIRAGTETSGHPPFGTPAHQDNWKYGTYRVDGHTTASGAGMFAHASRLLQPFDSARAAELLGKAILSWNHLQETSYPSAKNTQLMYAALQLYLATGDQAYHTAFQNLAASAMSAEYYPQWFSLAEISNGKMFEAYFFGYLITDLPSVQSLKDQFISKMTGRADDIVEAVNGQSYPIGDVPQNNGINLSWGSATNQGRYAKPLMMLYRLSEDEHERQEYLNVISQLADYTLGLNPLGRSYVSGLGTNQLNNYCHADSYYQYHLGRGNVPGIVVYGPNNRLSNASYQRLVYERLYPAIANLPNQRKFSDGWTWIGAAEFSTWETQALNACMYGFLGAVSGGGGHSENPPNPPSNLQASAVSHSAVELSWTDNATDESGFRIERRAGVSGNFIEVGLAVADATAFTDTNLSASTPYYYRVRAINSSGSSGYSNVASATTHVLPPAPVAPSHLAVVSVVSNQVSLSWIDNAANEEGFILERKTGASGSYQAVADLGADTEAYLDTGLGASTTYLYRVKAYNDGGASGYSNEVSAGTTVSSQHQSMDINTASSGSTVDDGAIITVVGSGSKIWGDDDGFRYVYQDNLSGNRSMIARVENNMGSSASGLAGVMVRQELVGFSKYMGIFIQQDGRLRSTSRNPDSSQWAAQDYLDPEGSPTGFPVWLKVEKVGNTITTFSSSDGITWTQRAQRANMVFVDGFHAGLAVCAWSETQTATAVFSNVSWPGGGAPGMPQNLEATQVTHAGVSLSWSAPSDGENVAGYRVYRNATPIGTTALTQFTDTTVSAATTYNYTVSAYDAYGKESAPSGVVEVTTPSSGNNPPVLAPLGAVSIGAGQTLQFTVSASDADGDDLSFSATGSGAD